MKTIDRVKALWPNATIEQIQIRYNKKKCFRVTITPGRWAYGQMRSQAWTSAWESITESEELSKGDPNRTPKEGKEK